MADIRICLIKFDMAMKWLQATYDFSVEISTKEDVSSRDKLRLISRHKDMEKYRVQIEEAYTVLIASKQALKEEKRSSADIEKCFEKYMDMYYSVHVVHDSMTQQYSVEKHQSESTSLTKEFQLPKINIARFSGSHTEWTNFNSIFRSLIHENTRLSPVQKLHYLLGVLDKEPLSLVRHLPLTDENYSVAYELLVQRYENKRVIADKHVEAILCLPNLTQVNTKSLNKFINTIKENTHALTALNFDVTSWSFLLLHIILKKIPIDVRSKFESNIDDPLAIPTFTQLLKFLEGQLRILENIAGSTFKAPTSSINVVNSEQKLNYNSCPCCRESHAIYYCSNFNSMTPQQRKQCVIKNKLCFNCLRYHNVTKCISKSVCQICSGRHHTKLHIAELSHKAPSDTEATVATSSMVQSLHGANSGSTMVLGTALVRLQDVNGHYHSARALIDSGSQASILTENLAQRLRLPRRPSGAVMGLGAAANQQSCGIVSCIISPVGDSTFSLATDCMILKRITGNLPTVPVDNSTLKLCKNLVLADKHFTVPGQIDLLLGIEVYDQILDGRKFSLGETMPTAYSSIFGWIVMGKAPAASSACHSAVAMACTVGLDLALPRFREVEEAPSQPVPDPEDIICEKHFCDTHTRDSSGRFIVRLPFKVDHRALGTTHVNAQLPTLNNISMPRRLLADQPSEIQLHGFSDASERGYAACVYLRVQEPHGSASVRLLLAKSRVAPLKQKLTVPKLELNGAHLLAQLLHHVLNILGPKIRIGSTMAWCDSSIVLAWLKISPHKLQTFEGNRVSQIQALVPSAIWNYVPSAENPADSASRGLTPSELVSHRMWWYPTWLVEEHSSRREVPLPSESELPGIKISAPLVHVAAVPEELPILTKFSSFPKLQSVVAWCKRFIHNSRNPPHQRFTGPLSIPELNDSLLQIVRSVQSTEFSETLRLLRDQKPLKGSIRRLNPFLDSKGFLRVGGRLIKSELDYSSKHPLLLPKSHHVTNLIVRHYHRLFLHPGLMALTSLLQRKFWILSARRVIRQQIFRCQQCYRLRPKSLEPFMGDLPIHRVTSCRPFQKVGVDFAGPFLCKTSRIRNAKSTKAYLCIFVCFTTKCVHLEIVSELSTDAFLACLDRFVSRRGLPSDIFSDCGTNFVGARNYLKHVSQYLKDADVDIRKSLANRQINWHLNPPSGPHMGGLWESAVRSAKLILARVIGERSLTFEELGTVFAKVEAALNSRPLCPLTNDPNDLEALTPGHFIIGQPLQSLPEQDLDEPHPNLLKRWQLLRQINQHFWRRWHSEYLHTMQQRPKWLSQTANLQVGDLVLIRDSNLPPLQWKRGRIIRTCPGADGAVRVAELRTSNGILLRPVVKLCPLLPQL